MNELKVGFLTILAIASLVVVALTITSNKAGFGTYLTYKTILTDASGIFEKSPIKVAGIVAGRIKNIELSGSQALVTFEVLKKIKITKFSTLRIKSVGFLGDKYLDIYLGDPDAPRLPEGAIVQSEGGEGFEQLGKDAGEILKDIKIISRSIRESIYNENKENILKNIIANIDHFTKNARELGDMLGSNTEKMNNIIEDFSQLTAQLAKETDRYAEDSLMSDLSKLKPIMTNVDRAVEDLRFIVEDVKAGKGTMGKLLRDEEVIDRVNETLAGVTQIVNRVTNFRTDISIYSGVALEQGSRTEMNLDLIPSPDKFFRFGLIQQNNFGRVMEDDRVVRTSVDNGAPSETRTTTVDEDEYKFNLQIGRKVNEWTFRLGLIDSTGGIGVDYNLYEYGLSSTLETFDFDEDLGPAVRLALEYRVWNVFYTRLTGEDLASKVDGEAYTLSAGLKFTDQDLAALFGLAL